MTVPEKISADYTLRPSELAPVLSLLVEASQPTIVCNGELTIMSGDLPAAPRARSRSRSRPGAGAAPGKGRSTAERQESAPVLPVEWRP